jgi:hypothetical protein
MIIDQWSGSLFAGAAGSAHVCIASIASSLRFLLHDRLAVRVWVGGSLTLGPNGRVGRLHSSPRLMMPDRGPGHHQQTLGEIALSCPRSCVLKAAKGKTGM